MNELLVFKDQNGLVVTTIGDIENTNIREIEVYVGAHEDPAEVAEQIWRSYGQNPSLLLH